METEESVSFLEVAPRNESPSIAPAKLEGQLHLPTPDAGPKPPLLAGQVKAVIQ